MPRPIACWLPCAMLLVSTSAKSDPYCVAEGAKNYVLATSAPSVTDLWDGSLLLQNVATSDRIILRKCSTDGRNTCYYATDVAPGKYYLKEAVPRVNDQLSYPISEPGLWFEVTGRGVDYIGDWTIERDSYHSVKKLEVAYTLKNLDEMIASCRIHGKKLFLDRLKTAAAEIVD